MIFSEFEWIYIAYHYTKYILMMVKSKKEVKVLQNI